MYICTLYLFSFNIFDMPFITNDFMLRTEAARELYHESAEKMPIIDYHCHLSPRMIAENHQFSDISELWLGGDHYKWRAMRANGVDEHFITGNASPYQKFEKWAETMPYAMRNPLYHWSHLELARVFGIDRILNPSTARDIYEECNALLQTEEFRGQSLIRKFNVEVVCTTDDPVEDLAWHRKIQEKPFGTKVLPTWRPDKALDIDKGHSYRKYVDRLSEVSGIEISDYDSLVEALQKRHDFFEETGCRLSDHGMDTFYSDEYTHSDVDATLKKALDGKMPDEAETKRFKSCLLHDLAVMDADSSWTQQFHIGPIRNNNTRMFNLLGPDTGFDAIDDKPVAAAGHRFLDALEKEQKLAKTILYCLNPKDNEVLMTMAYTFNDGSVPGKMQFGSGWWFLDQEDGMRTQLNALSNHGLLSRFVGMLTDSRSFISYPRHEYFRRILCEVLGDDIESGRLPASEMDFIHSMVRGICHDNARSYFGF